MKAITLWQPWATLVSLGEKRIETRSWTTRHRGLLAIHAGANRGAAQACWADAHFLGTLRARGLEPRDLPYGGVVALVTLYDVVRTRDVPARMLTDRECAFGDFGPGRWAWLLKEAVPTWHPVTGSLGLWEWVR